MASGHGSGAWPEHCCGPRPEAMPKAMASGHHERRAMVKSTGLRPCPEAMSKGTATRPWHRPSPRAIAKSNGQEPRPEAMAKGHDRTDYEQRRWPDSWPRDMAMAFAYGLSPWPPGIALGDCRCPWPRAMVIGHGLSPWQLAMVFAHGFRHGLWAWLLPWPLAIAFVHGPRPWPLPMAFGHGPRPWHFTMALRHGLSTWLLADASDHGLWPALRHGHGH